MDGHVAGTATRLDPRRLRFDYDDGYRRTPDVTPLSTAMPLQVRTHTDRAITPWLWNLLPDNDNVLRRWAREFHVSLSSPFALLSTPIGEDCAGAVRFAPPSAVDRLLGNTGEVKWLSDDDVAKKLRDLEQDTSDWHGRRFTGRFSLAGAQAKTALLHRDGRWGVPSGSIPTTHILKPAVAGFDDHDLNEHLCLEAARSAGLPAARSRVERFGNQTAVVIERYDRVVRGEEILRVHQEDLCQALGHPPSTKYQADGGPGPIEIVALLRRVMPGRAAARAVAQFLDALIWNWLIAGTDAHAKNYSLLLAGGQVRLAPLYDVASFLPYPGHERDLRFAMRLGGDYRVDLHANHWPRVAKELAVDADELLARVRQLAADAPAAFADAAASPGVRALHRTLPALLVDRVAARAARCARLVA